MSPPTLAVAPPAPPFTPHVLRYGLVPFERARDRPRPPLPRRETLILPSPHPDPSVASLRIPLLHHIYPPPTYPMHRRTRPAAGAGQVGWWACGRPVWGRRGGCSGPLEVRSVRSRGTARSRRAFLLILRFLRMLWAAACAFRVAQTFCYTRVCLLCVCGSGVFSPLHPLRSLPQSILFS